MEKTIKEMMEAIWNERCANPLEICQWKLSYFGDYLRLMNHIIEVEDEEI